MSNEIRSVVPDCHQTVLVLNNLSLASRIKSLSVKASNGHVIHLLGENGAGKSTLLHLLSGLSHPDKGNVTFNGQNLHELSLTQLAVFRGFQEQLQATQFPLKVIESLNFYSQSQQIPQMIEQSLEIEQFMQRSLPTLSGGETRRVHVARVLLQIWPALQKGQALVLLDEPTQGLDFKHQHLLFDLLSKIARLGNTIIVSHHDLNLTHRYAHQVWLLKHGDLVAAGSCEDVMQKAILEQAFSCQVDVIEHQQQLLFQTYLR